MDFASNLSLQNEAFGNLDLFVNAVNWLAEEEELINIQPRSTVRQFQPLAGPSFILVLIGVLCGIPAIVGGIGLLVWFQRRSST